MAKRASQPARKAKEPVTEDVPLAAQPQMPRPPAPVPLSEIIGQPHAVSILRSALASGRLHHAWVFHGPKGVGKFTAAMSFAASLLDPTTAPNLSGELEPDPESQVQHLLKAGTHPDLHVIVKELAKFHDDKKIREQKLANIAKDVVEQHLVIPATRSPILRNDGRASKVFIIDEAELLDRSLSNAKTQNSILKTMEEPEGRTVIILVTSQPQRLLPTIRSRCQQVRFSALDHASMNAWLKRAKPDFPADQRSWLLEFAEGSPGVFQSAAAGNLFEWYSRLSPLLAQASRGVYPPALAMALSAFVDETVKSMVDDEEQTGKEAATRAAAGTLFAIIQQHSRRQLRDGLGRPAQDRSLSAIDAAARAERFLDANTQFPFIAEWLAARLCEQPAAS